MSLAANDLSFWRIHLADRDRPGHFIGVAMVLAADEAKAVEMLRADIEEHGDQLTPGFEVERHALDQAGVLGIDYWFELD